MWISVVEDERREEEGGRNTRADFNNIVGFNGGGNMKDCANFWKGVKMHDDAKTVARSNRRDNIGIMKD